MGDKQRGKNCILKDEYVEKEKIIRDINKYYNVNRESANKIFKIFLENNLIIKLQDEKLHDKYRFNY